MAAVWRRRRRTLRRGGLPVPTGRGVPPSGGGDKRGQGHRMVPLPPLDSPQTLLWTRLPSVARLKARGPQGRLVLQGSTLDRSGAFRSVSPPPCTVWPRTVMRGKSRKVNSGHNSVPKANRRTEPSLRNPRFAAYLRCVSAKEGEGSQEGTSTHLIRARRGKEDSGLRPKPYLVSCPLLFPPVNTGSPVPPKAANDHALRGCKAASSGVPLDRRKVCRLLTVKRERGFCSF